MSTKENEILLKVLIDRLGEGRCDQRDLGDIRRLTIQKNNAVKGTPIPKEISDKLCPSTRTPKVGDWIYVRGAMSFDHGWDDVVGGLGEVCEVSEGISGGKTVHFVRVKQQGNRSGTNWDQFLAKEQEKLAEDYGHSYAYPDPDYNDYSEPGEWK